MTESEINAWRLAQSSLKYFMVKFLKLRWFDHYNEWEKHVTNSPRSEHQAHRGSGKSIFWSFGVPLWDVIRGPVDGIDPEDVLISYSEDQVRRLLRNIRIEVETNDFLKVLRPSTKEIWGTDLLSFPNGYMISGVGFGTSSRGKHPRRILVDDPLKDLGGMSQEDQERTYFAVISGMAMEKTQIHAIGTPVEFGDLFEALEKNPAYKHTKHPARKSDGSIQCPELFTEELLKMKLAEMGSINFAREMLLQRIDPSTQPFKRQYEELYKEAPLRFASKVTVCDPAYTEEHGDYTAIVTVGLTGGNHAYVLEAKAIRREDPGAVVRELVRTIRAHAPSVVGIEKRKGDAISYSFTEARTRLNLWDFKFVELHSRGVSKQDRINAVGGLVPRWEARSIHIHPEMNLLRAQLYAYRFDDKSKEHDDLVDALAYCFHPDMAQPNAGPTSVPVDVVEASQQGRPLFQLGQGTTWAPTESLRWSSGRTNYGSSLATMIDKRNHEAA